jgi:hypothetical protein
MDCRRTADRDEHVQRHGLKQSPTKQPAAEGESGRLFHVHGRSIHWHSPAVALLHRPILGKR